MASKITKDRRAADNSVLPQLAVTCKIVTQEPNGREIYYHLNAQKINEVEKWLKQFKQLIAKKFNQLDSVLEKLKHNKK